jgi:signal transduction histidine kinase
MILNASSFPWYLFSLTGELITKNSGILFSLPSAAADETSVSFYSEIRRSGWSTCPKGYAIYSKRIPAEYIAGDESAILVIPGLKVRGVSNVQGKSEGLSILLSQDDVSSHIDKLLVVDEIQADRFGEIAQQNVHEVRGINSGIYHAAHELEERLTRSNAVKHELDLAGNVVAFSQILSARLQLSDYLAGRGGAVLETGHVGVYKKFDKMQRCFKAGAADKKIQLHMEGTSFGRVAGSADLLELVAYLTLENAIKYSPDNIDIFFRFNETVSGVTVVIESVGPRIEDSEFERVFEKHYRGQNALMSGVPGSGIGLSILRRLVEEEFGGDVSLSRGQSFGVEKNVPYDKIEITLSFPRAS